MATIVSEFPKPFRGRYPWKEWADGRIRKLVQGVDFNISTAAMRQAVLTHAHKHGMSSHTQADGKCVWIQLLPRSEP